MPRIALAQVLWSVLFISAPALAESNPCAAGKITVVRDPHDATILNAYLSGIPEEKKVGMGVFAFGASNTQSLPNAWGDSYGNHGWSFYHIPRGVEVRAFCDWTPGAPLNSPQANFSEPVPTASDFPSMQLGIDAATDSIFDPVVFDWKFYLANNPDLGRAGLTTEAAARSHWNTNGRQECRRASPQFAVLDYLKLNPDVANALQTPTADPYCNRALTHYLQNGRFEARRLTAPYSYGWQSGQSGDATFGNEAITVRTSENYAGAISELWFRGKQYVNAHDAGRLFQTSVQLDGMGECNNPTEAGSEAAHDGSRTMSVLQSITANAGSLSTVTRPAYWFRPGETWYCGVGMGAAPVSNHRIEKTFSVGFEGDNQIVSWSSTFDLAENHNLMIFSQSAYLRGEFTSFLAYNPYTQSLQSAVSSAYEDNPFPLRHPYLFPPVVSTADGRHAIGVIALDLEQGATPGRSTYVPQYPMLTFLQTTDPEDKTTKFEVNFFVSTPIAGTAVAPGGRYTAQMYLVFGTLEEVRSRIAKLYLRFPGQLLAQVAQPRGVQAFDPSFYATIAAPDVAHDRGSSTEALLEHFVHSGATEGRNGAAHFNPANYLSRYPDLQSGLGAANKVGAFKHYLTNGIAEGRNGN